MLFCRRTHERCQRVSAWHHNGEGMKEERGGIPVVRDAPTHWPFISCVACSIFNGSQLTAAHTGSLVKNATHATTPAWQAHALVVLLLSTGAGPLRCLWMRSLALLQWLYLCLDGRLRARWSLLASSANPGSRTTWPRSLQPVKLSLRAEGAAGASRPPLRLFTSGTDAAVTPLRGPLRTSLDETWFSVSRLYWYADGRLRAPLFTAK